jgi:Tol biopolymer transport system component
MTPERWQRIEELYHCTRERVESDRALFLAAACAGDTALQCEVEALLDQPVSTSGFIDFLGGPGPARPKGVNVLGRRLGSYRVHSLLGMGGMGEVYRAHDDKLGRDVAIKVLPEKFAADPDRLARFEGEARMLAALNHLHIGAIYGLEHVDGVPALVLELVEGETLAERLQRGPIFVRDALSIARQVADALDAAHQKGIVHRDLKPANVKITPAGIVKVLDFGLAKMADSEATVTRDLSQSPTMAVGSTGVGVILGTAPYMSPEQARGMPAGTRADIWAFGCMLYEMLAGRPAFTGRTVAETFAVILEREPDWTALPHATPASMRELLRHCLQKDMTRRLGNIADARVTIEKAERGWNRWRVAAIAAAAVAAMTIGVGVWWPAPARPADRSEWVQLTTLPDSVIHPALSPDGRMVAFVRGPSSAVVPYAPGQVYVKLLPDGEPVQLTNDTLAKMSPAFSPDGARVAYTTVNQQFGWDTWTVPVSGGEPRTWLDNASGLAWAGSGQVLFSEIRKGLHMGIVGADEKRNGLRDVYLPAHAQGMAHLSYSSPDRKWVLLAEMDQHHAWTPCRVVPMDGTSAGRLVGPVGAGCTFGAWSPDGEWVYLTSNAGGANHVWRQRFPDGQPEQMTSGPTEEEGIAMAADGRSFVTAVALRNRSLWFHSGNDEQQISLEGNAVDAKFASDGKRLVYKVVSSLGTYPSPGDLRVANLDTGRSEALTPGFEVIDYDLSADGQQVVMESESDGTSRLWLARVDGRLPPQQIPNVEGRQPRFGPAGEILFRRPEGAATFVYGVRPDGTGIRKVIEQPIPLLGAVSPDGRFIEAWTASQGNETSASQLFPLSGGTPLSIAGFIGLSWASRGDAIAISGGPIPEGRSYVIPLGAGEVLPRMPAGGLRSEQDVARLPGARKVEAVVVPGVSPDEYAFYRTTTQRNLYRIPIP